MLQLGAHHGTVLLLVVQLQTLDEVLVHSRVLDVLGLLEDGEELVLLQGLLSCTPETIVRRRVSI